MHYAFLIPGASRGEDLAVASCLGLSWKSGPVLRAKGGSWLASARKSYINYLVHGRIADAADIGFEDADVKLSYT